MSVECFLLNMKTGMPEFYSECKTKTIAVYHIDLCRRLTLHINPLFEDEFHALVL